MDHASWPQAIASVAAAIAGIFAWLNSRAANKKIDHNTDVTVDTQTKVDKVEKMVNGRMTQLLESYAALAKIGSTSLALEENERLTKAKQIISQKDDLNKAIVALADGCKGSDLCHVLLVEDSDVDAAMLGRTCEKMGWSFQRARSADETIGLLTHTKFHAIFVDLVLPGSLDGFELIKLISATNPKTPLFVVTSYVDNQILRALKIIGAVTVFNKPVDVTDIKRSLAESANVEI